MADIRRFRALAKTWETYGRTDPLFGVLSDPAKYGGKWDVEEFFATGRAHVENLIRSLDDLRVTFGRDDCLDFGCGVGRLTIPLSGHFRHTVGVDVAPSMLAAARRYSGAGSRCEFLVNRDPDLRQFSDSRFDLVHSSLVLQHVLPEHALRYVGEFLRVCRPGGVVVFQLPSQRYDESELSGVYALPDSAYAAGIVIVDPPSSLASSERATVGLRITNNSPVAWPHDLPVGRHITVGNHWLHEDGTMANRDDGRARLPRTIGPGETFDTELEVQAPAQAGNFQLEVDLVQELVCWFTEKGSQAARAAVRVEGPQVNRHTAGIAIDIATPEPATDPGPGPSIIGRILRGLRRSPSALFEMHTVPRDEVEAAISAAGGRLLRAIDDNAAGPMWCSYTYVCTRR